MTNARGRRPIALVTGVGRRQGLGAAIAKQLASDGWDIASTFWPHLDESTYGSSVADEPHEIVEELRQAGAKAMSVECDLGDVTTIPALFDAITETLGGPVAALIANHTYCVTVPLMDTPLDVFDRHLDVNVRGLLVLIQEFARRYTPEAGPGRIVTLTSDHTAGNVAYGVSKGAADRLTDAAAYELGWRGISANAVNPGPVDTGWMNDDIRADALAKTPLGRGGTAQDVANVVSFLCSDQGGWITGQLLLSNGGFRGTLG
jgi:3-oxoacyl-[acyl-carrier protein] reductase